MCQSSAISIKCVFCELFLCDLLWERCLAVAHSLYLAYGWILLETSFCPTRYSVALAVIPCILISTCCILYGWVLFFYLETLHTCFLLLRVWPMPTQHASSSLGSSVLPQANLHFNKWWFDCLLEFQSLCWRFPCFHYSHHHHHHLLGHHHLQPPPPLIIIVVMVTTSFHWEISSLNPPSISLWLVLLLFPFNG